MFTKHRTKAIANRLLTASAAIVIAASLTGCANGRLTTGSISKANSGTPVEQMSAGELAGAATSLGRAYAKDPKDKATGLRYAAVLQMNGRADQALAVMRKLAIIHSKDREVLAGIGYHTQTALPLVEGKSGVAGVARHFAELRKRFPRVDEVSERGAAHAERAVEKLADDGKFKEAPAEPPVGPDSLAH